MNKKTIEELVSFLDDAFEKGVGHVNVENANDIVQMEVIEHNDVEMVKNVKTLNSIECDNTMACFSPSLHEGLDGKENDNE